MQCIEHIKLPNRWGYYILLFITASIFWGSCTKPEQEKKVVEAPDITHLQSSLFSNSKQDEQARINAFSVINKTDKTNYPTLSSLYSIIGSSYRNSFYFDSCVLYTRLAYTLALKTNDQNLQAIIGIQLLRLYTYSPTYSKERDSLFNVINELDKTKLRTQTQAIILTAFGEYYFKTGNHDIVLYVARNALSIYKEYGLSNTLDRNDSVNIGINHLYLGYTYSALNATDGLKQVITDNETLDGLQNLQNVRKWVSNNNVALSDYYYSSCAYSYSLPTLERIRIALLYQDSLISLANTTGYNFNDLLLLANHHLCNLTYRFIIEDSVKKITLNKYSEDSREAKLQAATVKNPRDLKIPHMLLADCRKYYNQATQYNHHLINPAYGATLQWLKGALYQREGNYLEAIAVFHSIKKQASLFFNLRQQQFYINDMILCYRYLNNMDSVASYYKEYFTVTDSLTTINLRKINANAEIKYQNRIRQEKIESQNIIIQYGNKERLWLAIGVFSLFCLLGWLLFIYRHKRIASRRLDKQNAALNVLNGQLDEANQTKSKLFAIISHDLRGPISQLYHVLKLQEAKDAMLTLQNRLEYDKQIEFATANLLESMEGLLVWSKTQMQSFTVTKSWVDINKLVEKCLNLVKPLIESKHLQVNNRVAHGKSATIETDANFLLAMLRNIVHNAIKASPKEGVIIIEYVFLEDGSVKFIKIINRGKPFTQQDYQQTLAKTKTSEKLWQGLGLQVVDELSRKIDATVFFETPGDEITCCTIAFKE